MKQEMNDYLDAKRLKKEKNMREMKALFKNKLSINLIDILVELGWKKGEPVLPSTLLVEIFKDEKQYRKEFRILFSDNEDIFELITKTKLALSFLYDNQNEEALALLKQSLQLSEKFNFEDSYSPISINLLIDNAEKIGEILRQVYNNNG